MLQVIRDNSQGLVAKAIVGLIIITFALFGIEALFTATGEAESVVSVNGVGISDAEVQNEVNQQKQQMLARMGANADPSLIDEDLITESVIDRLITRELMFQAADDRDLYIGDATVNGLILSVPAFQTDNVFDKAKYQAFLGARGFSPTSFKDYLRKEIQIQHLRDGIQLSAFTTKNEVEQISQLTKQTRDIGFVTLSLEEQKKAIEISQEELDAYYQAHQDDRQALFEF